MNLPGLNQHDTLAMAAAFCAAKVSNADIDWEKAARLMGSKSVAGARERLRVAKKKAESHDDTNGVSTCRSVSNAPVGGVDKKSPGKLKKESPKKATKVKKIKVEESSKPQRVRDDDDEV
ncbi:uncharacterized protein PV09_00462 [Verruconis gallopava]|uniref:Uncharacterized protein n=1 Tax=Verruconis gallopava TaxID=253628 RepID=A0A0D1Y3U0_9PEZI|nr:uncharacterized protein PV09_00462 [Verruconis gallopava]KIW09591.1 hypothetical protein PV09_00462 [Verruconis gallopava]